MKHFSSNLVYSQNGEEGILIEVFRRLDIKKGTCVEFGGHNGKFCSNTRYFIDQGWDGLFIEADPALFNEIDHPNKIQAWVTPENVNNLVGDVDLLSIDCDGPDYAIWQAYTGDAKVVVIEINSSYPPDSDMCMVQGTAYKPMVELGIAKGYVLLCHTGNLIFVQDNYLHLFPEVNIEGEVFPDPIRDSYLYFDKSFL